MVFRFAVQWREESVADGARATGRSRRERKVGLFLCSSAVSVAGREAPAGYAMIARVRGRPAEQARASLAVRGSPAQSFGERWGGGEEGAKTNKTSSLEGPRRDDGMKQGVLQLMSLCVCVRAGCGIRIVLL